MPLFLKTKKQHGDDC